MERLSIDFKGPMPSRTKNKYILTVDDEYSRYPFAFACSNIDFKTVISCLSRILTLFGACIYVHSYRDKSFMSIELVSYLYSMRIARSRTSAYNPRGNGQCEKNNDLIWSAVLLALNNRNLFLSAWESVLPQVLHPIRSLLCTATNVTNSPRTISWVSAPLRSRHCHPILDKQSRARIS